jgi:cytochrome P450
MFGTTLLRYEDCVAILRDKRWHNLSGRIPELMGIQDEEYLSRQRVSILSAEGDVHTRLRRLVAAHLSERTNRPEIVAECLATHAAGIAADIARQDAVVPWFEVDVASVPVSGCAPAGADAF